MGDLGETYMCVCESERTKGIESVLGREVG